MTGRERAAAIAAVIGRVVLWLDAYTAAGWDRRPLIRTAEDVAAWLGRAWRRAAADVRIRRRGPGRGLIAVVITRPAPTRTQEDRHV